MCKNAAFLLLLLSFLVTGNLAAQQGAGGFDYGNAWYDAANPHVKLRLWEDGIYRVTAADLAANGFSTNGVDPDNLHLYYRGREQYIYVRQSGGNLDFIEFYGRRNDGRVDSLMYRNPYTALHNPDEQPNIHTSLFSDTSAYFLTYDASPGLRYQDFNQTNYSAYSPTQQFRYEAFHEFHPNLQNADASWNNAGGASYDPFHLLNSYWITGEGYVGRGFAWNVRMALNVPTPHSVNLGNPSQVTFRVYGKTSFRHILTFDIDNNVQFTDTTPSIYTKTRSLLYNGTIGSTTTLGFLARGDQNDIDNNNYLWSSIRYDRLLDMDGGQKIKMVEWSNGNTAYLRFRNADIASEGVVFDLREHVRCAATGSGDTLHALIPGSPNTRDLYVSSDNGIQTPLIQGPRLSNQTDPASGAQFVIITHRSLAASANAYANYRDTNTVNQLSAKVVYTDEIYDEFGYGSITPWAIKRFCKYAIDNWTTTPEFFFLWGKGQYQTRFNPKNLVPTPGYPACDYDYVSDFDPLAVNLVPEVPIGRVNVENDAEGLRYLDKVNEFEHTPWEPWMKEVVFLGGGDDTTEQGPILNFLRGEYMPEVEGQPVGGHGNYYQKFNTGEITNSNQTSSERISEGVSVIHFFGHSNSNIYDVDIQEPVLYQNYGKYPLMIAFGCYGGNFVSDGKSFGERFVLEPGRGSIGYLANSTAGFLTPLGNYGKALYPVMFDSHYGEAIGTCIKEAHAAYWSPNSDQTVINHAKQMNLQGDPSVPIYSATKPDLSVSQNDVYFDPPNFSAADSSFTMNVIARNLGRATQDSFYFSVRQRVPQTGNWIEYASIKHPPISNSDTISLTIYNTLGAEMAGLNTFDIFADSTDLLDEYRENNNRITFDQLIPGNVPAILFPYDYAVIRNNRVTLAASAYVMDNIQGIPYVFEIDTVTTFNSPRFAGSGTVVGSSALAEWEVPFDLQDSTVYYWRVRLRDIMPPVWATASFKYIANRQGWAQSRPPQFFRDPSTQIQMDEVNREWSFEKWAVELHAFVNEGDHGGYRLANGAFASIVPGNNNYNGVLHTGIRKRDLAPTVQNTNLGDWLYSLMPDTEGDVVQSILGLAEGDYYFMVSERNPRVAQWSGGLFNALAILGADTSKLRNIPSDHSFIFFGQKGNPSQAITITDPNIFDQATNTPKYDLRKSLETNFYEGEITSTAVGPATEWFDMWWDWSSVDAFPQEDVRVEVFAVRPDNTDSLVYSGLARGNYPLAGVDATRFPYLRLEAETVDSVARTAPQLDHWHVIYAPAPEALIDPSVNWAFDRDSVIQGEPVTVSFSVRNISEWDMDSLLVRFIVQDPSRALVYDATERYMPLNALTTQVLSHTFSTSGAGMNGNLALTVEINPYSDQPEQYHFNNLYTHTFFVRDDRIHPILDVTVDGKHLMDGDIVSPDPEIIIEVNDDNPFLAVNDTAFEVHFGPKTPISANLPRIFIDGNTQMEVVPAELPDNKAQLIFKPGSLPDGDYTLRVQGFDYAGNASGNTEYEIDFEVINASTLTNVLNYPNPFSTSTRFVYTLTGSELPERFELHIYTISGRLVKVIDLVELDEVRIGQHITDFAWDGRDEFGDLLANGVYVYKVISKLNGEEIEYRDEGVSSMFKKGFGKMYIMR